LQVHARARAGRLPHRAARAAHARDAGLRARAGHPAGSAVLGVALKVRAAPRARRLPSRAAHLTAAADARLTRGARTTAHPAVPIVGPRVDAQLEPAAVGRAAIGPAARRGAERERRRAHHVADASRAHLPGRATRAARTTIQGVARGAHALVATRRLPHRARRHAAASGAHGRASASGAARAAVAAIGLQIRTRSRARALAGGTVRSGVHRDARVHGHVGVR
jgi:hypothetical protein